MAAATSVARKVPLNESGATSTGRSVMLWSAMAAAKEYTTIEVCGHELRVSSPEQGLLPRARIHEARPRPVLPGDRRGDRPRALRPPDGAQALEGRDHRRGLLPEARAREAPRVAADRDGALPVGPQRHRARAQRRRPPHLGRQPRQHRLEPVAGAPQRPRPSRRAAHRPRPAAGRRVERGPRGRAVRRRRPARARDARLPQDERLARHPRQRPHRAALGLHRGAPRRARAGARGRAPHARTRDDGVVEGGAHRRLPRLQPERARPHRRLAVLGARGARREGVLPAALGRGGRRRARGPAPGHRARAPARGRRRERDDRRRRTTRSTPLLDLARRDEEEGLGDAPWPPHFAKQAGEPERVQPSRARSED